MDATKRNSRLLICWESVDVSTSTKPATPLNDAHHGGLLCFWPLLAHSRQCATIAQNPASLADTIAPEADRKLYNTLSMLLPSMGTVAPEADWPSRLMCLIAENPTGDLPPWASLTIGKQRPLWGAPLFQLGRCRAVSSKRAIGERLWEPMPRPEKISSKINAEWRSGRDSNPRYAFDVYSLSRRAPSTTRPPLRIPWECAP